MNPRQSPWINYGTSLGSLQGFWLLAAAILILGFGGQAEATQVATPVISVAGGQSYVQFNTTVTDSTSGATLYYTLDGTTPTTGSSSITSGQTIQISHSETLNVMGVLSGDANSAVASAAYNITGQVVSDGFIALALREDGTVWAWGSNTTGEKGNGTTTTTTGISQISSLSGISAIAVGARHCLAVKNDGTVWGWGLNSSGQLGDGTTTQRTTPVQVSGLTGVVSVAAGQGFSLALKSNGSVWAWGTNSSGQLGVGTTTSSTTPVQITTLSSVLEVACTPSNGFALKSDGTVWSWGSGSSADLGTGSTTTQKSPVQISGLSGVVEIAAGNNAVYALKSTGTVQSWGFNNNYQLGDGTTVSYRLTPVSVSGASGIVALGAGISATDCLALKNDGTVEAWGYNGNYQLGDGTVTQRNVPVQVVGLSGVVELASGSAQSLVVKTDGSLWGWGSSVNGIIATPTRSLFSTSPIQVSGLNNVKAVAGAFDSSFALKSDGTVWGWGDNGGDQLATSSSTTLESFAPLQIPGLPEIVAFSFVGAPLVIDNEGNVGTWGGLYGTTPVSYGSGFTNAKQAVNGGAFALFLKNDGSLWASGDNSSGEFGLGNTTFYNSFHLAATGLTGIASISSEGVSGYALKSDGTVWGWGSNTYGQLGNGTTTQQDSPIQVGGLSAVSAISASPTGCLALETNGTVWEWGSTPPTGSSTTPIQVAGLSGIIAISSGTVYDLALKNDGTLWAWGVNGSGQLGDGTTTQRSTPVQVQGLPSGGIIAISAGDLDSMALKDDGTVLTWGDDTYGELGIGGPIPSSSGNVVSPMRIVPFNLLTAVPTVSISSPANNAVCPITPAINVQVNAAETGGTIARVDFYNDWTWIGSSTVAPFTWAWTPSTYGSFHLTAIATDSTGNPSARSTSVNIQVEWDSDGNGLADWWEIYWFHHLGNVAGSSPDGNGYTLWQDYQNGSDPTNYYSQNGQVVTPTLTIVSGNNQTGPAAQGLPNPLVVQVKNASGAAMVNAPVTFTVMTGTGGLATSLLSPSPSTSLQTTAASDGTASLYFIQPDSSNFASTISAQAGTQTQLFTETTQPAIPPKITSPGIVTAGVNLPVTYAIVATQSPTSYGATGLPPGLSVNGTTGIISGTPTTAGIYNTTLTASTSLATGVGSVVFNVVQSSAAPVINSPTAALAETGSLFSYQITATNAPLNFGATGLPAGLSIDATTGAISGTVATAGSYTIALSAANGAGTGTAVLTLAVDSAPSGSSAAPAITSSPSATGTVGTPFTYSITATNSPTAYGASGVPPELNFNSSTGVISGTPVNGGSYPIIISATNAGGTTFALLNLTVPLAAPAITSSASAAATQGTDFTYTIGATNSPTSYAASSLPSGLNFDPASGIISGTPSATGTFTISLGASNAVGTGTQDLTLTVSAPGAPVIGGSLSASAFVGSIFSYTITASGNPSSYSASPLPPGMNFSSLTGEITGFPMNGGTYSINLGATNATGTGTATLNLTVASAQQVPVITSPTLVYYTPSSGGPNFSYTIAASNGPTSYSASNLPSALILDTTTGAISVPSGSTFSQAGTYDVTINAINGYGQGSALLKIAVCTPPGQSSPVSATAVLQAGGSPNPAYATTSAGIASDTSNPSLASGPLGQLIAGTASATQSDRALLGFDLSVVPPDATITDSALTVNVAASSAFNVELYQASGAFDPASANWAANSTPLPPGTLLNICPVTNTSSRFTWTSSSAFVSAVQTALNGNAPLDLLLLSNEAEGLLGSPGYVPEYLTIDDETAGSAANRPMLTVAYTSQAPTVLFPNPALTVISGASFSYTVPSLNGAGNFSATGLDSTGLTIDPSSGTISGTAGAAGAYSVTLSASNAIGGDSETITVNIGSPPTLAGTITTTGTAGAPFTYTVPATGSTTFSAYGLPDGLSIDPQTGVISGTPNPLDPGTYTITIETTNAFGTTTSTLTLTVNPGAPLLSVPLTPVVCNQGVPITRISVAAVGGPMTYVLSSELTSLGLSIDSSGFITGTPTATTSAQGVQGTVTITNSRGSLSVPLLITVLPLPSPVISVRNYPLCPIPGQDFETPSIISVSLPLATGSESITLHSDIITYTGLPSWLSIDDAGEISGTPPDTITDTVEIDVTASASYLGQTGSKVLQFLVQPTTLSFTGPLTATANIDTPYSYSATVMNGVGEAVTSATGLPPGLTYYDGGQGFGGYIQGTPTQLGTYNVVLTATEDSVTTTSTLVLTVVGFAGNLQVGVPFTFTVPPTGDSTQFQATNLPPGLSIDAATGIISGTPLTADSVQSQVTTVSSVGSQTMTLFFTIAPNPSDSVVNFQQGVGPTSGYDVPSANIVDDSADNSVANESVSTGNLLTVGQTSLTGFSRALLTFDLSFLPAGATITSASLVMHPSSGNSAGWPAVLQVYELNYPFDPANATWANNNFYGSSLLTSLTIDPTAETGAQVFPISANFTQAVQQAWSQNGKISLAVMALNVEGEGAPDYFGFVTNGTDPTQNPQLEVTYSLANPGTPAITSPSIFTGTVGVPLSYTITATNAPKTFSATPLPTGLEVDGGTGIISGTVSTVGSTAVTVTAGNNVGSATQNVLFNIDSATPATGLVVTGGNNQVGLPNAQLANPLTVKALLNGAALPNSLVIFSVPPGKGAFSLSAGGIYAANTLTVGTDANGLANAYFQLPPTVQTVNVTVAAGKASPVTMIESAALVNGGTGGSGGSGGSGSSLNLLSVLSGEGQSGSAGQTLAQPFVVQATDATGEAIGSLAISANVVGTSGQISSTPGGSFGSSLNLTTDSSGDATIYLQPGGPDKTINSVSCTAANSQEAVYLTAVTAAVSASSPAPGGGTMPVTDGSPPLAQWNGKITITAAQDDPTSVTVTWPPAPPGVTLQVEKRISAGNWLPITPTGNTYSDSGLQAGIDYHYQVIPYVNGVVGTPVTGSYNIPSGISFHINYKGAVGTTPANTLSKVGKYNGWGQGLSVENPPNVGPDVNPWGFNPGGTILLPPFPTVSALYETQPAGGCEMFASEYKWSTITTQPVGIINLQWAEVFLAPNYTPVSDPPVSLPSSMTLVNQYSTTLGGAAGNETHVFTANYPTDPGVYSIIIAPQLQVENNDFSQTTGGSNGGSSMLEDPTEKLKIGVPISVSSPGTFFIALPGGLIQTNGSLTETITWTGDFKVFQGHNQLTSGQTLTDLTSALTVEPGSTTSTGDSTTVTLVSSFDGTVIGTDSAKFYVDAPPVPSTNYSVPIDEASGSRYRKIALNGLPLADEKPQQSAESEQEKEETYVDALTLGLRHSTTDAYMPVSGSDFAVSARRDFRSQVWDSRNGLRPHEQPDLPFGMCWSSNLTPSIKIIQNGDPSNTTPTQVIVTDNGGAIHTFYEWDNSSGPQFFPMPTAKNEAQTPNLETLTSSTSGGATYYTFSEKYKSTLTYQLSSFVQSVDNDRLLGSKYGTIYNYARLVQAVDRVGNTVLYQYQGNFSLVPATITVQNQSGANPPGIKLSIQQTPIANLPGITSSSPQSVVTAIWDANGNETTYQYSPAPVDSTAVVLSSVTAPDGSITRYSYSSALETDFTPHAQNDPGSTYAYVDLSAITDPRGNTYSFSYAMDHSKWNYMQNTSIPFTGYYPQSGVPRDIAQVTMPDDSPTHADATIFHNDSKIQIQFDGNGNQEVVGQRVNEVTDATKFTRTYTFGSPVVIPLPSFPQAAGNAAFSKIVAYQNLQISYGTLGGESFTFDIGAGMALKQVIDFSGNTTTFAHGDAWSTPPASYAGIISNLTLNGFYDDPTCQTDALGNTKKFSYDPASRIMTDVVDENKNHTHYDLDALGRRTTEIIYDPQGNKVQETDFAYTDPDHPGFMTSKVVKALDGAAPGDLTTQYVADANGRVTQEIVDPGGLALITAYAYDANGNKTSSTDPKGHTTWFDYDSRNRLTLVTYADGSYKSMTYDGRGNKTADFDELGHETKYCYDPLNRLKTQTRLMNGNGPDLSTSYTYDNANDKLTTITPGGNTTTMWYDNLERVTQIQDAAGDLTKLSYGVNSGGNVFDSASFKPTQSIDARGFTTVVGYDVLYRPLTKAVTYCADVPPSTTTTGYDFVGNPTLVTDPLGKQTATTYDALNRPTLVTYADGSTSKQFYTSTGLKWKVVDPNLNATVTCYDPAGRATQVTQPGYDDGAGPQPGPVTKTFYDAAGNVAETVNPRGKVWDYVYDARNRKLQELEPSVADASNGNTATRPVLAWNYDAAGKVTSTIDARGNETDTCYDPANRVTEVKSPAVPVNGGSSDQPDVQTTYDLDSNVHTVTQRVVSTGSGTYQTETTVNNYDQLDRLHTTTDAAGITVTNNYDAVGNKTSVEDGKTQTTKFGYDGLHRNTCITDPAGNTTHLKYDALNKTQRIDALGQTTTYFYDVRNRLLNTVYSSSAAANSQRNYAYDPNGNLLSVTEPAKTAANVAYGYDSLNRVKSETSGGLTHAYYYDAAGNRTTTTYGGTNRVITSCYDALNRLGAMTENGRTSSYGYDLNGNIVTKTLPNGDTETDAYDACNRASSQTATSSGSTSLYTFNYGYDLIGNLTSNQESYPSGLNNRTVTNSYDLINRLTTEAVTCSANNVTTVYAYDCANNRTSMAITGGSTPGTTTYSYNNLDQLTGYTDGTRNVALAYDLNGNRTTRTVTGGTDNGTDTYTYDFENRLIGLVKGTAGGAGTYNYQYDYRTRRILRDESPAGGIVTSVVFSGGTSVQEYPSATPSGAATVEYVRGSDYGGGVGGILYTLRSGSPSYTHENRRGDVVAKTDGSGSITYQAQYQAFGTQTATSGSTLDRQKSNSKDTDPTNLVDEGFRYRDLETGMFTTRDPAGMIDGPNEYTYVVQNPWTKFDPEGLDTATVEPPPATAAPVAGGAAAESEGAGEYFLPPWAQAVIIGGAIISAGNDAYQSYQDQAEMQREYTSLFGGPNYTINLPPSTTSPATTSPAAPSTTSPPVSPNPGGQSGSDIQQNNVQEVGPPAPPAPQKPPAEVPQGTPNQQAPNAPPEIAAPAAPAQQSGPINPTASTGPNGGQRSAEDQKRIDDQRARRAQRREDESRGQNGQNRSGEGYRDHDSASRGPSGERPKGDNTGRMGSGHETTENDYTGKGQRAGGGG